MKKIMSLIVLSILLYVNTSIVLAYNDYVYFPGGSYSNNSDTGLSNINILSKDDFFGFRLYQILFGNDIFFYKGKHKRNLYFSTKENGTVHSKLFQAIFEREYNKQEEGNLNQKLNNKFEKEVELAQLRYEKISDAQRDTKEIEKRLFPVLELYFNTLGKKQGNLHFIQENVCGESLFKGIDFSMKKSEFSDITKYYLFAVSKHNFSAAPWGKNKSLAHTIVTEKDLLTLNKRMFLFQEVQVNEKTKSYKVKDGVQEKYEGLKYMKEHDKFINKDFLDLTFGINYSDLVDYYKEKGATLKLPGGKYVLDSTWRNDNVKMSFSLLGVNADGKVQILSYDTGNISVELNDNITSKKDIIQACKDFEKEPENRLLRTKVGKLFEKLDKKFGLEELRKKDNKMSEFSDVAYENMSHYSINYWEEEALQKYKKLLNKLYSQVSKYQIKLDKQITEIIQKGNGNILSYKNTLEKVANIRNILRDLSISTSNRLESISRFINRYDQESAKIREKTYVTNEVPKGKLIESGPLYSVSEEEENKDGIEDKYGASEEDVDKYLIRIYYGRIGHKEFEQAYSMKHKPNYSLKHFKEIYADIIDAEIVSKNFLHLKDRYKFKVLLTDTKGEKEKYIVNVQIIDGKIKTLSSKKIK